MNDVALCWYYSELCSHDGKDSGDGDADLRDYIRDHVAAHISGSLLKEFNEPIEYCYTLELSDRILIVFRGTRGRKAWLNNARVFPPYVEGYMHKGFHEIAVSFFDRLRGVLDTVGSNKPLYITGHSLGGILSQYTAKFVWEKVGRHSTCINFGAPCGGIAKWRTVMDSYKAIYNLRVVNGRDLVTEVLDDTIGAHAGLLLKLPRPVWFERIPALQLLDHAYSHYTRSLIKYCETIGDSEGADAMRTVLKRCLI